MMKMMNAIGRAAGFLTILALVLVACGRSNEGGNSSGTPASTASVAASGSATAFANPLVGEWDTGPYPFRQVRAAIIAGGVTHEDLNRFVREIGMTDGTRWEVHLTFYDEGGVPYFEVSGWNPDEGEPLGGGDHEPYKLLPNHRIRLLFDYNLWSYRLSGDRLTLRFIRNNDPSFTPAQRRHDTPFGIAWTAAPLSRVT
jgi:hypothetical protein